MSEIKFTNEQVQIIARHVEDGIRMGIVNGIKDCFHDFVNKSKYVGTREHDIVNCFVNAVKTRKEN